MKSRGLLDSIKHHLIQVFLPLYKLAHGAGKTTFVFSCNTFKYFFHTYSATWSNERSVEIPIFQELLSEHLTRGERVLEVGNVLSHYKKVTWDVVDKYEIAEGVLNEDIVTFKPEEKYALVFSISTFEHVGFDEAQKDASKIDRAIEHVKHVILKDNGLFIISIPLGYNAPLDKEIYAKKFPMEHSYCLKRRGMTSWSECTLEDISGVEYGKFYYGSAAGLVIFSNKPL